MTSTRQIIRAIEFERRLEAGIVQALHESLTCKRLAVRLAPLPTAEVIPFRPMPKFLRGGPNFGSAA